jgi:hypothetical protein
MLSSLHDLSKSQGLDKSRVYSGIVVDDDDSSESTGKYCCRIRVRIPVIYDDLKDDELPWAIPKLLQVQGSSNISGTQFVPLKGTRVNVEFQDGSKYHPMWVGTHVDQENSLQELQFNYPHRAVTRFPDMTMLVVDTKDKVAYLRLAGTLKLYIQGNVEQEIVGNVEERISGNVTREIKGNLVERVLGSKEVFVAGDFKEQVKGGRKEQFGSLHTHSDSDISMYASSEAYLEASSHLGLYSSSIDEDFPTKGSPGTVSVTKTPNITTWSGIRGGSKGTNDRK